MVQFHDFNWKEGEGPPCDHFIDDCSFDKYLWNIYYLLDIVLGTVDKAVSKSGKISLPSYAACILVGEDNNNQDK